MNFYLDFEATQYTDRIISIGCVADSGHQFYCLVKTNKKISPFITELTGITEEMLEQEALEPKYAFNALKDFIDEENKNSKTPSFFFCYGNEDKKYLLTTLKDISDYEWIDDGCGYSRLYCSLKLKRFIKNLAYSLIDYSEDLKDWFNIEQPVGLKKVLSYLEKNEIEQKHNALDDAEMLYQVVSKTQIKEKPIEHPFVRSKVVEKPKKNLPNKIKVECVNQLQESIIFESLTEAKKFIRKKFGIKTSQMTSKKIRDCDKYSTTWLGYKWKIVKEAEEQESE
jgi:hypothetical protein